MNIQPPDEQLSTSFPQIFEKEVDKTKIWIMPSA